MSIVEDIARRAKEASFALMALSGDERDRALLAVAQGLDEAREAILAANSEDIRDGASNGLSPAMIDRLTLTESRFKAMVQGVRDVAALPDPLTRDLGTVVRPSGIEIKKVPVSIGVIAIIFESRPNVTADAAALCIKSGNAAILRGGKEAIRTNIAIARAINSAKSGLPQGAVSLIESTDRAYVTELVQQEGLVDVVIPRGGESLIRAVVSNARVPVLKHYNGICHIYVDESADFDMAFSIIKNAKCQRPGTCNAVEKVLVCEKIAADFVPKFAEKCKEWGVRVLADESARQLVPEFEAASDEDLRKEYLSLTLTLYIVRDTAAAISHINRYGSHHSDAIITEDKANEVAFLRLVDSAAVYVNASTRFTDGGEFGMGCEMGISTDKLHARGPVGIEELTTYKYQVIGHGSVRK